VKIKITLIGSDKILKKLQYQKGVLKDFSKELDEVGKYLVRFHRDEIFDTEGQIIGQKWQPLKSVYEYKKRQLYPGAGILVRTGNLRRGFIYDVNKNRMVFRNKVVSYGPTHQFGDPRRNIPQRMFFLIDKQRREKIVDIIHAGVIRRLATS